MYFMFYIIKKAVLYRVLWHDNFFVHIERWVLNAASINSELLFAYNFEFNSIQDKKRLYI